MTGYNPYSPPVEGAGPLVQRFPNPNAHADRGKVAGAGVTLIIVGCLQLLMGLALAGGALKMRYADVLGIATLVEGVITLICGIMTLRNSYGAAVFGLVLSCIGLLLSVLSFNLIGIGIRTAIVILVGRGVNAIKQINSRIMYHSAVATMPPPAAPAPAPKPAEQANPLVAYYHHFVTLLVQVMGADGHLDRRERQKIAQICDAMSISEYERERVIQNAERHPVAVGQQAKSYLALAEQLAVSSPKWQLMVAAVAVASADGVIAEAEEKVILEIGRALGLPSEEIWPVLAEEQVDLDKLSTDQARNLLNVKEDATADQIEQAHSTLSAELAKGDYAHLGQRLTQFLVERQKVLDRAKEVLAG